MIRGGRWVPVFLLACACQGAAGKGSECGSDCSEVDPPTATLCGSDDSLGFIGVQGLGPSNASGAVSSVFGADVLTEIGYTYVAISKSCAFWSYRHLGPNGIPGGVLYSGQLSEPEAKEIGDMLRLEAWENLGPTHGICCVFDYTPSSYHWGARTLHWIGTPDSVGPPALPSRFPVDPARVHLELAQFLSELGEPSDGAVRYTVMFLPDAIGYVFSLAPIWPLDTPISEVAITDGEVFEAMSQGIAPPVHRAEGEDADKLRALRGAARAGEFGGLQGLGSIPIEEPDGSRYFLFVRDVGAFETPEGVPERDPSTLQE